MESGLVDEIGVHLKPLISAAATDSRGKEACRTYGPFLLQASQLVGHALGKKGLGTQAQADWLAAARHLLGGLMVIAPHTQCKHPLQLEKLAMGLFRSISTHACTRRCSRMLTPLSPVWPWPTDAPAMKTIERNARR